MFFTSFTLALQALQKNKARAGLTIIGIVIGIAMVIIVLSAGAGLKSIIMGEIASFGDNWIDIEIKIPLAQKHSRDNASALGRGVTITTLTDADARAIEGLQNIDKTYAGVTSQLVIAYGAEKRRPMVFGVTASFIDIDKSKVAAGRFFTEGEERSAAEVVVLGSGVAEDLFGNNYSLGERVRVDKGSYEVIGVMEERGATGFMDMDNIAYLPLRTLQKKIMGIDHVLWIIAQTVNNHKAEATAEEIRWLMRERHDISNPDKDDFAVTTMEESIKIVNTIVLGVSWLLIALVAISLVVGGVGIMNVMYVSVVERTFEIGLRKAVGATNSAILMQFLLEAVIITAVGGVIGIVLGSAVSYGIAAVAQYLGYHWKFLISPFSVVLGISFSTAVGLVFGLYPARQASSVDPVVSLRQ